MIATTSSQINHGGQVEDPAERIIVKRIRNDCAISRPQSEIYIIRF